MAEDAKLSYDPDEQHSRLSLWVNVMQDLWDGVKPAVRKEMVVVAPKIMCRAEFIENYAINFYGQVEDQGMRYVLWWLGWKLGGKKKNRSKTIKDVEKNVGSQKEKLFEKTLSQIGNLSFRNKSYTDCNDSK